MMSVVKTKELQFQLICCVKDCGNKETETTTLFMFPEDEVDQLQWKVILNIDKPISQLFRVCSDHFRNYDFKENDSTRKELKPDSLPSKKIPPKKVQTISKTRVYNNYKCAICKVGIRGGNAFGLPNLPTYRKKWIEILGGEKKVNKRTVICFIHFESYNFKKHSSGTCLKSNAIPTLYLNEDPSEEVTISDDSDAEPEITDNLNMRRYNFGTAFQSKDESLDDYFYRLEILAKLCEYNEMREDLIRDRFIIGIDDEKLREKLLGYENLTLNQVVEIANITIKKEIEFVTVLDELPEMDEIKPEIKNEKSEIGNLTKITKNPIKPLKPLNKCHKCNETFRYPHFLFQHILLMHSLKFLCKICKAKFHSSEDLTCHVNIYHKTGENPTIEETLSHTNNPGDYYSSDSTSSDSKQVYPYMCELCATIIKNPAQSVSHKMKHAGTKPYLCTTCGLGFQGAGSLRSHEMVHTGEKPFMCGICSRCFSRTNHLKSHMWSIHKIDLPNRERTKKEKAKSKEVTLQDITMDINFDVEFGSFDDLLK